jgi:uncharacterized protein YacL
MATLPPFSFSIAYFTFILSVTLTSLTMILIGGWITRRLQKGGLRFRFANKSTFSKKFFGFLLFICAIFTFGWLSERLQSSLYQYLQQNVAQGVSGIVISLLIAYFMYDWIVWRKHNKTQ